MSFGKRGVLSLPTSRAAAPVSVKEIPSTAVRTGRSGKIGIGIAFAIAVIVAYYSPMRRAGQGLDQNWAPAPAAWESLLASFDGSVGGRPDLVEEGVHQTCKTVAQAKITGLTPKSRQFYLDNWMNVIDEVKLERVAAYLGCAMLRDPERLCVASRKARLVAVIKGYYELLAEAPAKERERRLFDRGPWSNLGSGMERDSSPDIVVAKASDAPDHRVVTGLRALAGAGLVSIDDFSGRFGFGTPAGITDAIGSIAPARSSCR